jgi:Holliday junction resolvase RusA-like endonuclease
MERIILTVYGQAIAKERHHSIPANIPEDYPETGTATGQVQHTTYTPAGKEGWIDCIREQALIVRSGSKRWLGPVILNLTSYQSWPEEIPEYDWDTAVPFTSPNCYDLLKLVMDALHGSVWKNDGQVVGGNTRKRYGSPPRVEIELLLLTTEDTRRMLRLEELERIITMDNEISEGLDGWLARGEQFCDFSRN